ncbi:arsenic resistance N-acetyltransferase ArsN2 [Cesiribacter sp. SM1]|uniref:arsenic resistance N-acetyltransferase ArsN2 n=1 Tax=Cesiribacter sp. SM1 TaxID=2861196 RepID=UPI001CD65D14|nr:arsenic resistance N-acetyltransferase ArsN2 [Cesiribacter sp. SM1]
MSLANTLTSQEHELLLREATPGQRQEIAALLSTNKLPVNDLTEAVTLYALMYNGNLAGSAGLEIYGTQALLRSVSVADSGKGRGWGKFISHEIEKLAQQQGIEELYLVTTTAEGFFQKLGYRKVERSNVAEAVLVSGQFNGICPASAAIMVKQIQ